MMPPPRRPRRGRTRTPPHHRARNHHRQRGRQRPNPGLRTFQRLNRPSTRPPSRSCSTSTSRPATGCRSTEERQLRQHRRRAGAVADAARGLPERRRRHQPHGDRRPQGADGRRRYTNPSYVSQHRGTTSRARRTARAAAWSSTTSSPPTASTSSSCTFTSGDNATLRGHRHVDRRRAGGAAEVRERSAASGRRPRRHGPCAPSRFWSAPASTGCRRRSSAALTARTRI